MYSDCWTYPKEVIDDKIKSVEHSITEKISEAITEKESCIIIGDTAICYGVKTLASVTTSNLQEDITLPVTYKNDSYAVIVTNNTYYDSNVDVAGIPKSKTAFTLWAKAVSSTHTDAIISWMTIGKIK